PVVSDTLGSRMKKTQFVRSHPPVFVESLENRLMFSAASPTSVAMPAAETVHVAPIAASAVKASRRTMTSIHLSHHLAVVGQPIVVTVTVKSVKGAPRPAGTIEIIDNGTTVQAGSSGSLDLTLSPAGRTSYRFQVGKVAFYPGFHNLSALFSSSNA